MTSKTLTVELHSNATTDKATLTALVKVLQFRPEIAHVVLSGIIAQIEYAKKQTAINTTEGQVAALKA